MGVSGGMNLSTKTKMTPMKTLPFALFLTAAAVVVAGDAAPTGPGSRQKAYMETYDTNKDGRLDESEKVAMREALGGDRVQMRERAMERFDKDGDGKLNDDEKVAAREAMRAQGRGAGPGQRMAPEAIFNSIDANGDGVIDRGEWDEARGRWQAMAPERRKALMKRVDTDGDGKVSDAERQAARDAWMNGPGRPPAP